MENFSKIIWISLLMAYCSVLTAAVTWQPRIPIEGRPFPIPRKFVFKATNRSVSRGQIFVDLGTSNGCDILENAKKTYESSWFIPTGNVDYDINSEESLNIKVVVKTKCPAKNEYPQDGMNEAYHLTVPDSGSAQLEAHEVWGALRGLETISQLIFQSKGKFYIRTGMIKDWPEFHFRALLIDTGRHFLSKNVIKRQIDLLAQNKMNVLHWHITDSESFPYVSRAFPELALHGSYTPNFIYSQDDVKEIVNHGRLRGVRILAEFDTPGHMASWRGIPDLMTKCSNEEPNVLDPSNDRTFQFLEQFFTEVHRVFPEKLIHLGGDEIAFFSNCWLHNEKILKFMEEKKMGKDVKLLVNYYFDKLQNIIDKVFGNNKSGSNVIFWEEVFQHNNPRNNSMVHVWLNRTLVEESTKAGHRTILSQGWYLDHIHGGQDWDEMYANDPRSFPGTKLQKSLIVGGEACMWGEFIDNTNIEPSVWPRASAVAERLWSNPKNDWKDAVPRIYEQRCRSLARGFYVRPTHGPDFCPVNVDLPYPAI